MIAEVREVYAQEIMRLKKELTALRLDASSKWAFLEWRDRAEKAEAENAAQLKELHCISEALGTNDGHSSVTHIELLKAENAKLRELLRLCKPAVRNVYPSTDPLLEAIDAAMKEEGK